MSFNIKIIVKLLSILALINSVFLILPIIFGLYYDESIAHLLASMGIHVALGGIGFFFTRASRGRDLKKREGFLVVTLGWIVMALLGSTPYLLSQSIPDFTNAFFESIAGYTTTGSTILDDIENMPKNILVWRSLTQWIGGMGMIVLVVAILPILGVGSVQLFSAESPGLKPDKMTPRIADTAKRLWVIYLSLTLLETVLLMIGGMGFFDAINHSFTTISTGGFSTKQASIGHFDSAFIEYVITAFMFLGGTSFVLIYFFVKLKWNKLRYNEEFKFYAISVIGISLIVTIALIARGEGNWEESFRSGIFQVTSIITTTGYATADYLSWGSALTTTFFLLLLIGGSSGSTSGGIKVIRHIILIKNSLVQMKKQVHPSAVIPVRINNKSIPSETINSVLAFAIIYMSIIVFGTIFISAMGVDFSTAVSAAATSLGNVGPGIGRVGPEFSFSFFPNVVKWILSLFMIIGRLEIFTVLVLFTSFYWDRN